jgi:hypothetical protein
VKIATRNEHDLTHTVLSREIDADGELAREFQTVTLRKGRAYDVLAVDFFKGREPVFWVLGEEFSTRVADGLVYPDLIAANDCRVVHATIPSGWLMGMNNFMGGTRTIAGVLLITEVGFMERLTDGEPVAVKLFLNLLDMAEQA